MTVFGEMTKALSAIVLTTFGEPVVFHIEGQTAPIDSTGVFTAMHQAVDASTGVAVSTVQPMLEVDAANCRDHLPKAMRSRYGACLPDRRRATRRPWLSETDVAQGRDGP